MNKLIDIKQVKFYLWVGLAYMTLSVFSGLHSHPGTLGIQLLNELWRVVYIIVLNFILFEFTIPFIKLRWGRLLVTPFLLLAHLLFYSFGIYIWRLIGMALHIYHSLDTYESITEGVTDHFGYSVGSIFFFGIIKHVYNYRKLKVATQRLRIEKQEAELNYLKSQTNPHFLFNTLNNIYSLARDKSDLAPESILRLSKILRFMLYEAGAGFIAIEQELKIISDYIELEKLRYDDSLRINFNNDIEDMKQAIPPLLMIPLVENAFKHGVSETRNQPFIDIHLSVNKRQLKFVVKNSSEGIAGEKSAKENIGLSNLRRQLQLLYTDYQLSVEQSDAVFTTILKINLGSHV